MNKFLSYFVLLSLLLASAVSLPAQSRQRRVGQASPTATPTAQAPSNQPGTNLPSRPPVLGGANRPAGERTNTETIAADNGPDEVDAGDVIKVDTTLVTLPVSVMDRDGKYIPNLRKEDFRLWEDGTEQTVAFFSAVDKPFSVVLMLDTSGSTRFKIEEIQDAAITFVNQLRSDDRVMVVSFDEEIRVLADFTSDRSRLRDAIRRTRTGGGTRLYDAVDLVINQQLSRVSGRKAVVLFTDGVDTTSKRASYDSNLRDAEELDALVYPVQYDTYADMSGGGGSTWPGSGGSTSTAGTVIGILGAILNKGGNRNGGGVGNGRGGSGRGGRGTGQQEYGIASRYLHDIAERTGARTYEADSNQSLSSAFGNIADELRRQYSLGYYPKNPASAGQRRHIKVKVNQPNLAVRTRDTYVFNPTNAPSDTASTPPVLRRKLAEDPTTRGVLRYR
jgi:VWFA-related protein